MNNWYSLATSAYVGIDKMAGMSGGFQAQMYKINEEEENEGMPH